MSNTRVHYRVDTVPDDYIGDVQVRVPCRPDKAVLVSSICSDDTRLHMPVLDIDVPHRHVPSATPGHAHLYLDVPMTWRQYKRLLKALAKAGIVEPGYVRASISRKASFVRVPWLPKGQGPDLGRSYVR